MFYLAQQRCRRASVSVYLIADRASRALGHTVEASDASGLVYITAYDLYTLRPTVVLAFPAADAFVGVYLYMHHRVLLYETEYCAERTPPRAEFTAPPERENHENYS